MPVAPSFQSMPIEGEPFTSNGKQYVNVRNTKTGKLRTVRWYSEKEYAKLYPSKPTIERNDEFYKSQKELLGFEKGYITAFKDDTYPHKEYLKEAGCKYTRWWGWYVKSTDELPSDLPAGLTPVRLYWNEMCRDDEWLKSDEQIREYVNSQMFEPSKSEYVGEIGERLELNVVIDRVISVENGFGYSTMYIMTDENENGFIWITTSAKDWEAGQTKHIRGTVKSHKMYQNIKQTYLSRCSEVKE